MVLEPLKDQRLLHSDPQWLSYPLQPQIILLILLLLSHPSPIFHLLLAQTQRLQLSCMESSGTILLQRSSYFWLS